MIGTTESHTEIMGLNFHLFLKLLLGKFACAMLGCKYEPPMTAFVFPGSMAKV